MKVQVITPPRIQRKRRKRTDQAMVAEMARLIVADNWATDGTAWRTRNEATSRAQGYRRAIAEELGVEMRRVRTRVWAEGERAFRFAVTLRPA